MGSNYEYLALYMASFFIIAISMSCLGTLIPFLAEDQGIQETQYSILFFLVSIGCLLAAFLYKMLEARRLLPKHHVICIICIFGMIVFSIIMAHMRTKFSQCLVYSIFNMFSYILVITVNICLLLAPSRSNKDQISLWMSFSHGFFGVGALVGPILVRFLQQNIFIALAIACLVLIPLFWLLASPESNKRQSQQAEGQLKQLKYCSKKLEILFGLSFFILVGIEITIQGWIPTYAVLMKIQSKQEAVKFTSIFWTLSTIFRFVFGYMRGTSSCKLTSLIMAQLLTGIMCTLMAIFGFSLLATYSCSILYGISLSQLFPLLMSVSTDFDLYFSSSQMSNLMVSTTISSGVFSTLTGVLMKWDLNMFFYSILVFSLLLYACAREIMLALKAESTLEQKKEIEFSLISK